MNNEIIEKYQSKTVQEIEKECLSMKSLYTDARKEFIEMIFYLQETKRYRENPKYKKAVFSDYLWGMFGITETQFYRERKAFTLYPEQVKENGLGTVVKVVKKVRAENQQRAFNAIQTAKDAKKTPIKIHEIDRIIEKHSPIKKTVENRTAASYEDEIQRLKMELMTAEKTIAEQAEQIEKLKATVQKYRGILDIPLSALIHTSGGNKSGRVAVGA